MQKILINPGTSTTLSSDKLIFETISTNPSSIIPY